jgi:tRNA wybutosine-synthesizing protein 2
LAIDCLKDQFGFIHYHEVCPDELLPDRPTDRLRKVARKIEKKLQILNYRNIKSYAPGVSHVVLDVKLE